MLLLERPMDETRLHAVCSGPPSQRNLYPSVFYCIQVRWLGFSAEIFAIFLPAWIIYVMDQGNFLPDFMEKTRLDFFVATLKCPKAIVGHLQAWRFPWVRGAYYDFRSVAPLFLHMHTIPVVDISLDRAHILDDCKESEIKFCQSFEYLRPDFRVVILRMKRPRCLHRLALHGWNT